MFEKANWLKIFMTIHKKISALANFYCTNEKNYYLAIAMEKNYCKIYYIFFCKNK